MGPVLCFKCTVCKEKLFSKGSWLRHLLEPVHRDLARKELIENWRVKKWRKRMIIAYSKQLVGKDERILQYFSKNIYKGIVTDFVWWEERPGVGFIQFESREVVDEIIESMNTRKVSLDGQKFQVKAGKEFLKLEWDELLPLSLRTELQSSNDVEDPPSTQLPEKEPPQEMELNSTTSSTSSVILPDSPKEQPQLKTQQNQAEPRRSKDPNHAIDNDKTAKDAGLSKNKFLGEILKIIQKEVEIPDEEYSLALNLLEHLNKVIIEPSSGRRDVNEAHLFRNWSLKLHYHQDYSTDPAIFITKSKDNILVGGTYSESILKDKLLKQDKAVQFHKIRNTGKNVCDKGPKGDRIRFGTTFRAGWVEDRIYFDLYSLGFFGIEAQLWRLAKYLISFDQRAFTLLQVVYFWANVNKLSVGTENVISKTTGKFSNSAPDPLGLTWMVLFFLYGTSDGGKIIPTPEEILKLLHKPIYYKDNKTSDKIDLGFEEDPSYRSDWKKKDSSQIFKLICNFFKFWGRLSEDCYVIDTRHGKYYLAEDFINKSVFPDQRMKTCQEYVRRKRDRERPMSSTGKETRGRSSSISHGILHMSNPFHPTWSIPILSESLSKLKKTRKNLEGFLDKKEWKGNHSSSVLNKESVKALFKL